MPRVRDVLKTLARAAAFVPAAPFLLSFAIKRLVIGPNRALEGSSQSLACLPGLFGVYVRRAFLSVAIERCASSAVVEYGTLFSQAGAVLEDGVYVGPNCHLGLVHLERGVLLAAGVHVPSGARTHGIESTEEIIRDQPQTKSLVRIGAGTWVGSAAVVMADVGREAVIGAGAVVTRPVPDFAVAAGVPARVLRSRRPAE